MEYPLIEYMIVYCRIYFFFLLIYAFIRFGMYNDL